MMERAEAEKIVDAIVADLGDRRGLGGEWDAIDDDVKAEIRATWIMIVRTVLDGG